GGGQWMDPQEQQPQRQPREQGTPADEAQAARDAAAKRTSGRARGATKYQEPGKPPIDPNDRGWFTNAIDAANRMGGEARAGFQRRIEQAEREAGPDAPFSERLQAYNRAFDPHLEKAFEGTPGYTEAVKQTYNEALKGMQEGWQNLTSDQEGWWMHALR